MRKSSAKDKELEYRSTLLRAWKKFHAEQLEAALAGVHADVMSRLMAELKHLRSARELIDFIAAQNWSVVSYDDRAVALHEINRAITALRERHNMSPFDDGMPGDRPNVFQSIRGIVTGYKND